MHNAARVANLLGVVALAVAERTREAAEDAVGAGGAAAAALVHLHSRPGESVSALGRVLGLTQPGAVRLVDRLVALGLVTRATAGATGDGRSVLLSLTAAGQERAAAVLTARSAALQQILAGLEPAAVDRLVPLLEQLVVSLPPAGDRQELRADEAVLQLCRLCDRDACRRDPGCPIEEQYR